MIRYTLSCAHAHDFEGWFRNSEDFEQQKAKALISCPVCGSVEIGKKLMAPAVSTARSKATRRVPAIESAADAPVPDVEGPAQPQPTQSAALMPRDTRHRETLEALRSLRKRMIEASDYVGKDFPEEARRMHYGESKERNIYGETTLDEAKALLDEGIDILPLPALPDEKN